VVSLLVLGCGDSANPWQVRLDGMGPVQFGMDAREASRALGMGDRDSLAASGCRYLRPESGPPGLSLMIEHGKVVRVDVDSSGVPTAEGIQVGSSEAEVRRAYGDAVSSQPHKYRWEAGWRYLIYRPPVSEPRVAVVFEADSERVRSYRAGLEPQVEYVERCG
jgi:hypothetical protein